MVDPFHAARPRAPRKRVGKPSLIVSYGIADHDRGSGSVWATLKSTQEAGGLFHRDAKQSQQKNPGGATCPAQRNAP
jgi:hypothetical protein